MGDRATFIISNEVVSERLAEIDSIADAFKKVEALVELAAQLLPSRLEVLAQALNAANATQSDSSRSSALAAIAPQLPATEPQLLEQALTAATAISDEYSRSSALAAIAPQLSVTERFKVLEQALTAATAISDEYSHSSALAAIAPQLPATEPQLLERALTAATAISNEYSRSRFLVAIAPQLPATEPQLLEQALTTATAISGEFYRSSALAAIAPQLPATEPQLLEQALTAATAISDDSSRSSALAAISSQLPVTERFKVLEQALTAATAISDESHRSSALAAIAPQLPATERFKVLEQALTAATAISDESHRSSALAAIAPQLPATEPQLLEQALTAATAISDEHSRSKALAAIAPRLPATERFKVLEQALTAATAISDEPYRSRFLVAIAPQLPATEPQLLEQALTTATAISGEFYLSSALAAIAPQLPATEPQLLEQALTTATAISDDSSRSSALAAIAPQLPATEPQLLEQALTAATAISDEHSRSSALAAIAPQLPATERFKVLEQALTAATAISDESHRSSALAAIAPQLPATERFKVLEQALTAATAISDESHRSSALAAIAPQLPATERFKVLERALTAATAISDEYSRSRFLVAIAPQLPATEPQLLEQALTAATAIPNEFYYYHYLSSALAAIAPQLPATEPQLLEQVLTAATAISDESHRSSALAAIAPQLPATEPQLLERALTAATAISDEYSRSRFLVAIAPQLPATEPQLLEQALTAATAISNESYRSSALAAIAPQLPVTEPQLLEQALTAATAISDDYSRSKALAAIAPQLPATEPQLLEQALTAATAISDLYRSSALAAIAPQLPATERFKVLEQALTAATAISNESYCSKALVVIASQLPETYLPQILKATSGLSKENAAEVLKSLAIRFTEALAIQFPRDRHLVALEIVKALPQDADKTKLLSALAPHLSIGLLPNALRLIQDAFTQDAYRAEAFSNLVPYLSSDQLLEALRLITHSIQTPRHQATALENLIPFLSFQDFEKVLNLLENHCETQPEDRLTTQLQTKTITEPKLKARILRSVATALAAVPMDASLSQPPPPTESKEILTPRIQEYAERALLIERIFHSTEQLKTPEQNDFSYEKAATDILSQLAPALAGIKNIKGSIPQFKDLGYQAQVLGALFPYFPESADSFLKNCTGDDYRALLNIKVRAASLNTPHIQAQNSSDTQERDKILKELNEAQIQLDITLKTIEGQYRKAEALAEVARYSVGSRCQTEALQTSRGLSNVYLKVQYLHHLIPGLLDTQRLEAANIIREIPNPYYRAKAFVALACKFPEFRNEAKAVGQTLDNRVQRIEQLSILAIEVPEILPNIIDIAEEAEEPIERRDILVALAPHLPMRINREVNRERSAGRLINDDLWDRALYLLARGYRDALQGGSLRNETAQDKDFLNLQDEINALTDLLLMRDLEPPMTVGILGGWGGGKSYIMHLMQTHMTEVRSHPVTETEAWNPDPIHEKLSPYVGHIYQIKFDAWTFAKSDLWASLMQTIFFELNRQITLEQKLQKFFNDNGIDPYAKNSLYGSIWKVLYQVRDEEREYFLERVLQKPDLENLDPAQQDKIDELLWKKRDIVKQAATEELQKQETALKNVTESLKQKQEQLEAAKTQLKKSQEPDVQQLKDQVNQILVVSGVLLRKRIGDDAFKQLNKQIEALLPNDLSSESLQKFGGDLRLFVSSILEGTDADGKPFNFSFKVLRQWGRKNLAFIIIFFGFAAASVLAPFLVAWKLPGAIVPQIVAFVAPLLPAIGMAQKLWRAGQRWYDQTKQALLDCEIQIKGSQALIKRETQRFQKHQEERIATLQADIDQLTKKAQELEEQVKVAQEALPENVYASLHEFVADRIKEGVYDQHLGLMHLVKEDLTNLSYRLLPPQLGGEEYAHKLDDLKAVFPRGPARVVVYIDDLDRCPPDRVVQVLEAVQLLVKTPLFIAVLAIDERYITRALEKFYDSVLTRRGRPSGTDYLEKIIQLPYRVRPIMANTLESYLRSQVVIQDSATGGAKFSEFSRQEFNMLLACCQQVDLSPRTLKRLTNVYKLFKIVCRTRGTKPNAIVQQAILALLALSGRYPNLMRGIFDSIETCFEEQRTPEKAEKTSQPLHLRSPLCRFFEHYQLPEGDRYLQREFDKLKHDALQTTILPPVLSLEDMTHEIFNLIRSFSFVGEIGENPGDYRISGTTVDDQSAGISTPPSSANNE